MHMFLIKPSMIQGYLPWSRSSYQVNSFPDRINYVAANGVGTLKKLVECILKLCAAVRTNASVDSRAPNFNASSV